MGQLQVLAAPAVNAPKAVAVICHPHPQYGGTMHNKVITTLHRVFHTLDMHTVRFNYRGVEGSEGSFDQGIGETADALTVLDWAAAVCPGLPIYLAGFSFGSYVSYRVATDSKYADKLAYLISITMPPYPETATLPLPQCPWLLVQGEADELFDAAQVFAWAESLAKPPVILRFPETSHFFHGKLVLLRDQLIENLK